MKTILLALACAVAGGCMEMAPDDGTGVQEEDVLYRPPPQWLLVNVNVIMPTVPVEHRPVFMDVTFTNQTTKTRSGTLQADITQPDGSIAHSTTWQLTAVASNASTHAILEFDAPTGAASVPYVVHYYDSSAPTVPAESNATASTFPVAIRATALGEALWVTAAADSVLGDSNDAQIYEFVDGVATFSNGWHIGIQHNGSAAVLDLRAPSEDLVPGTSHHATYTVAINRTVNWGGGAQYTEAKQTIDLTGDSISALMSYTDRTGQRALVSHFCNGYTTSLPCSPGYSDYTLESIVERVGAADDTVPMDTRVYRIRTNQTLNLPPATTDGAWITYSAPSGQGAVFASTYVPPSVTLDQLLVRLTAIDSLGRTAFIYVEVRPAL